MNTRLLTTKELLIKWNGLKKQMLSKGIDNCSSEEKETLKALRQEIDRRQGGISPVYVNFAEDYITK